jgi:hypothetical protein
LGVWGQEVGVPYVDTREAVAQSAALSPDGETFYTYVNNTLTHWSLNPVKVLESVKIEDSDFDTTHGVNIYVSPDLDKIIFTRFKRLMGTFDLKKKGFTYKASTDMRSGYITGTDFITINKNRLITIYNAITLQKKKEIQISEYIPTSCDECSDDVDMLLVNQKNNHIIVLTGLRLLVLDNLTFQIIHEIRDQFDFGPHNKVSIDRKKIIGSGTYYDVDMNQVFSLKKNEKQTMEMCANVNANNSMQKYLSLYRCDRMYSFYDNQKEKILHSIYFFKDRGWLIINTKGYFDGSPESRKYLYMKTPSGESVPINDATFQKFHKQINLKD